MYFLLIFSALASSAWGQGPQIEWQHLSTIKIDRGIYDNRTSLVNAGATKADLLMFGVPSACNTHVQNIYATDSNFGSLFPEYAGWLRIGDISYQVFDFKKKVSLGYYGFRAETSNQTSFLSGDTVSTKFPACSVSFFVGLKAVMDTAVPVVKTAEYLDCFKVSADLQFFFRDELESTSVLEEVIDGVFTCRVFTRFNSASSLLSFYEKREQEGKSSEFEILRIKNKVVRINFSIKII